MTPWLLLLLLGPEAAEAPALTLRVTGLVSETAPVRAALYDSKAAWEGEAPPARTEVLSPQGGVCEWRLPEAPPGELAARVFQDLDGDGELDRDERGRPTEPYGFSGVKSGLFGPPGWKKVRFEVGGAPLVVEIELRSRDAEPDDGDGSPG